MVMLWNYDKPHRCPGCHSSAWYYASFDIWLDGLQWWKTYHCPCGARFSGRWAWFPKTYYRLNWKIRYYWRELTR